jgi:post-segregation antitoxin (ccd killing protein)
MSSMTLDRRQIAAGGARLTGYFATESGGHFEVVPDGISSDALLDEAVLVRASAGEVCVELTLRSDRDHPVDDYTMTWLIDGDQPVLIGGARGQGCVMRRMSYADGMAVDRLTVTVPRELGAALRALAEARGVTVSAIVADAIAHQVRMAALDVALDEADRSFGPIDDAQVTAAEAALVKAAKRGPNRGHNR